MTSKKPVNPVLAEFFHGEDLECQYRGAAIVMGNPNNIIYQLGDVNSLTCIRSALKPLQSLSLILSGAADGMNLTEKEIALSCSSHNGEEQHVRYVRNWINRIGSSESELACGAMAPDPIQENTCQENESFSKIHNACSGKHAGFLTIAYHLGVSPEGYNNLLHPVQKVVFDQIANLMGISRNELVFNTDFCDAPNIFASLKCFSKVFVKLLCESPSSLVGKASLRILDSVASFPNLVAGTGRFCTALAEFSGGNLIGKMGAEGAYVVFIRDQKRVCLVKIDDGSNRAAEIATCHILENLGVLDRELLKNLKDFIVQPFLSGNGEKIGEYRPAKNYGF